jgi:N-acetylglutamate synthase-like GNAT family acetyltransferase
MNASQNILVRAADAHDRNSIERLLNRSWGSTTIVTRGNTHDASQLPALLAVQRDDIVGLATFRLAGDECELMSLDALRKGRGIGSALLDGVANEARRSGCRRLWLITTNDNVDAIRFYQRRGLRLIAIYPGAVDDARRLKPSIPLVGQHGIPIRDELEFELELRRQSPNAA